jgi:hypothetical protein
MFYFLVFLTVETMAQQVGKLEMNAGYGFYDAFKIGMAYHFKQHMGAGGSIGFDDHFLYDEKYISISIEWMLSIFRSLKTSNENHPCRLHNRIYIWWLEDRFYQFRAITYSPCIVYRFDVGKRVYISCSAGPAVNFVVYNFRKTFDEVGWPHYVQFNPGIQLNYVLNK